MSDSDLNQTISLDVTDFVANQQSSDGIVSFALVQPTNENAVVAFSAKESAHPPILEVTTDSPPVAATIHSFSSQQSGNEAVQLIDGIHDVSSNRWSANSFPQWVIIDYGANQQITGAQLWTYQNRAYRYQVELSTDLDFSGDLVVDRLSSGSTDEPITDTFAPVAARYAKLTVVGASGYSGSWVSLREFAIQTTATARSQTTYSKAVMKEEETVANQGLANEFSLLLYPNPATTEVEVYYQSPQTSPLSIMWTNLAGQLVQQQTVQVQQGSNYLQLSTKTLPHGLYVVKFASNSSYTIRKLQVVHHK